MTGQETFVSPPSFRRDSFVPSPNLLLGLGNDQHGDDGAGIITARLLKHRQWLCLDAGTAPENFTATIRQHHPRLLVIVDAATMGLAPGHYCRINQNRVRDCGFGTHGLPISQLMNYLQDCTESIVLVGIEPLSLEEKRGLSAPVKQGVRELVSTLKNGQIASIPEL